MATRPSSACEDTAKAAVRMPVKSSAADGTRARAKAPRPPTAMAMPATSKQKLERAPSRHTTGTSAHMAPNSTAQSVIASMVRRVALSGSVRSAASQAAAEATSIAPTQRVSGATSSVTPENQTSRPAATMFATTMAGTLPMTAATWPARKLSASMPASPFGSATSVKARSAVVPPSGSAVRRESLVIVAINIPRGSQACVRLASQGLAQG
jgi:hypothetical protein